MKKIKSFILFSFIMIFMFGIAVLADEKLKVMEVQYDQDSNPFIFVKGIEGTVENAEALIDRTNCDEVVTHNISDEAVSMKTLILLDNSLSIPDEKREPVKKLIKDVIESRSNNEKFALATFGESIEMIEDYTDNVDQLKTSVDGIEFFNRETYLTDVLYELIKDHSFTSDEDRAFKRILIISDGVDNKQVGIKHEEWEAVIEEDNVPIYTVGVFDSKKSNSELIKNMSELSRKTGADTFVFDDLQENGEVVASLNADSTIVRFDLIPPDEVCDGKDATVKLEIEADGSSYTLKVKNVEMPQKAKGHVVDDDSDKEKVDEAEDEDEDGSEVEEGFDFSSVTLWVAVVILVIVFAIITGLIISLVKKGKSTIEEIDGSDDINPAVAPINWSQMQGGNQGNWSQMQGGGQPNWSQVQGAGQGNWSQMQGSGQPNWSQMQGGGQPNWNQVQGGGQLETNGFGQRPANGYVPGQNVGFGSYGSLYVHEKNAGYNGSGVADNDSTMLFGQDSDEVPTLKNGQSNTNMGISVIMLTDIMNPSRYYQKEIIDIVVIGRSAKKADICITDDSYVSGKHCMIQKRGNRFYLSDLGSSNGTFLNDVSVTTEMEVYSGCILRIGNFQFKLEIG